MIDSQWDEKAALAALGWSEDPAALTRASATNLELAQAIRDYADIASLLAFDAPQVEPPAALRARIIRALEPRAAAPPSPEHEPWSLVRLFRVPHIPVMPYTLAACLMGIALFQAALILLLDSRLDMFRAPAHHDPFSGVQLVDLEPQGDHGNAKIMVAWNQKTCCGMISMSDMPDAPAGNDYQLWVLDPSKPAPINAGVVPHGVHSQHFIAGEVQTSGRPGFAVSLEPAGGRPVPTPGAILFAVAPSP